jgi:FMN-dependent oxidoreductase (nitrilotriacetate monooxygenase family)
MSGRQLHINVNVLSSGTHPAAWRASGGNRFGFIDIGYYQEVARLAERGRLDAVFFADQVSISPDPASGPGWGVMDPIVTVAAMAGVTTHIGFIATATTTFTHPYNLARAMATLDHVTHGRVGLNLVTTMAPNAAANFGLQSLPVHDDRYGRAAEFADVLIKLWDSWEDGALVGDVRTGLFADPARIHGIDHVGKHFSVAGPLQTPRSPQGRPLLVQAGGSEQGRDFAARYADAIFSVSQLLDEARSYYADVKERARRYGRDPDKIAILPGLVTIIGGTEAEAHARRRELDEIAGSGEQRALEFLARRLGVEPKDLDLDRPAPIELVEGLKSTNVSVGFAEAARSLLKDRSLTVRQILAKGGAGHRRVVGAPEQIADTIEEWFRAGAADGVNLMADVYPTGLEAFVDHVVPILQKRGLFRRDYSGATLRDHYGLERPASIYETEAPAALASAV